MKENVFKGVDWSEAPEWANYWTCDQYGGNWWESFPDYDVDCGMWKCAVGNDCFASDFRFTFQGINPEDSLVRRPSVEKVIDQSSQPSGFSEKKDRLVQNPSDCEDRSSAESTEAASWIWCNGTKNSGGCFTTEADAARDAVKHSNSSETFYVAQVTRVIKPFKRSVTA